MISIHALREEGDHRPGQHPPLRQQISIHALREEGDTYFYSTSTRNVKFLSTPSARWGLLLVKLTIARSVFISIHALREEGDHTAKKEDASHAISIHALREEGDAS